MDEIRLAKYIKPSFGYNHFSQEQICKIHFPEGVLVGQATSDKGPGGGEVQDLPGGQSVLYHNCGTRRTKQSGAAHRVFSVGGDAGGQNKRLVKGEREFGKIITDLC